MLDANNQKHFLILALAFFMQESVSSFSTGNFLHKTCTNDGTYNVILDITLERCVENCQRRKRCTAIMYHQRLHECKLKDSVNMSALTEEDPICEFKTITERDRQMLKVCANNDCDDSETCENSLSDQKGFTCVKNECPEPRTIENAKLLSNMQAVGCKNCYKCEKGYTGVGDPFITCTNSGIWTQTAFTCYRRGNAPIETFENGELIEVVGGKWLQGTVIRFNCRPGFEALNTTAESKINRKGEWNPKVVRCCNNNSTERYRKTCLATFNASVAHNREEMRNYCKKTGGYFKRLDLDLAKHVFKSGQYHLLVRTLAIESFREDNNLTLCLAENINATELENFSNYTYDKLVNEVVSRNITGKNCETARWWAPGQPIGGLQGDSLETCIVFNSTDSKMYVIHLPDSVPLEKVGFVCAFDLPKI